ncbi:MAG TPA: alpha/beta fold hydrolase [Egicoccus sp.]|nr:alpha/beta fold hydrolase [Egicoccus sp.]HSK24787.1 alpha/beta fold hydrolase [Egicoccus sp.]
MTRCWLLVHSPIVGPDTWEPVASRLRATGDEVVVPALRMGAQPPFAARHVDEAVSARLPGGCRPVVVAHSGAGGLLGAVGRRLGDAGAPPAAYVLADAGVPASAPASRLEQLRADAPELAEQLEVIFSAGGRFPNWTDEQLAPLVPDPARRALLVANLQPAPAGYWTEPLPVTPGWPDAPGAVMLFSGSYEPTAAFAAAQGWPLRRLADANHFLPLADPEAVAAGLVAMADGLAA